MMTGAPMDATDGSEAVQVPLPSHLGIIGRDCLPRFNVQHLVVMLMEPLNYLPSICFLGSQASAVDLDEDRRLDLSDRLDHPFEHGKLKALNVDLYEVRRRSRAL